MLTQTQIDALYAFCKKKGVRYYDVQTELVDHLASAIEDKMAKDEALSFEDALMQVYKGFGITGFSSYLSDVEANMNKESNRFFMNHLKSYFSFPKIAITFLLITILSLPFMVRSFHYAFFAKAIQCTMLLLGSFGVIQFFCFQFDKRYRNLMIVKSAPFLGFYILFSQFCIHMDKIFKPFNGTDFDIWTYIFYCISFLFFMLFYSFLLSYRDKIKARVRAQYPELFIAKK